MNDSNSEIPDKQSDSSEEQNRKKTIEDNAEKRLNDPNLKKEFSGDDQKTIKAGDKPRLDEEGKVICRDGIHRSLPQQEKKTYQGQDVKFENGFPVFPTNFETYLSDDQIENGDKYSQFQECNKNLYNALKNDPSLKERIGLKDEDIECLIDNRSGEYAQTGLSNFSWHHHQDTGRMQLVDSTLNKNIHHVGGEKIWGKPEESESDE